MFPRIASGFSQCFNSYFLKITAKGIVGGYFLLLLLERLMMFITTFISVSISKILIQLTPFREKDCGLNLSALAYRSARGGV